MDLAKSARHFRLISGQAYVGVPPTRSLGHAQEINRSALTTKARRPHLRSVTGFAVH